MFMRLPCLQPPMPCSDLTKTRRNSVPSSVVHILLMRVNSDFCCLCSDCFHLLATRLISQDSGQKVGLFLRLTEYSLGH